MEAAFRASWETMSAPQLFSVLPTDLDCRHGERSTSCHLAESG